MLLDNCVGIYQSIPYNRGPRFQELLRYNSLCFFFTDYMEIKKIIIYKQIPNEYKFLKICVWTNIYTYTHMQWKLHTCENKFKTMDTI